MKRLESRFLQIGLRILTLIILIGLIWFLSSYFKIDRQIIAGFLGKYPIGLQWFIFIFLYTGLTFFIWPIKDPLKIIAAIIFGAYISTFLIYVSEIINAFLLFYSAKYLIRGIFVQSLKGTAENLDDRISKANFIWLFLLRFVPLVPYRILDTTAGITKINFRRYLLVVIFASPIRIFWIQYILTGIGESAFVPSVLVSYFLQNRLMMWVSFIYFFTVIIVAVKLKRNV